MRVDHNQDPRQQPAQVVSQAHPPMNAAPVSGNKVAQSQALPGARPSYANERRAEAAGDLPPIQTPTAEQKLHYNLSSGEGILKIVERHSIGLVGIYLSGLLVIVLLFGLLFMFESDKASIGLNDIPTIGAVLIMVCLSSLVGLATMILASVYKKNKLVITNESVILQTKMGLFGLTQNKVGLDTLDDISFKRQGLLQVMFNYGSVEISAMGDKGYKFSISREPRETAGYINNMHEIVERRHYIKRK